jgi:tRNA(adenine34) deaminase
MHPLDEKFMAIALEEARRAMEDGEVPVGAVVVYDGEVIARAHNLREGLQDPAAHAEMLALREAARKLHRWRLTGAMVYSTLEPCAMCAGALVLARIDRLVYGCDDPKAGACGSVFDIVREPRLNHRIEVLGGVMGEECGSVLKEFFENRRSSIRAMEQ